MSFEKDPFLMELIRIDLESLTDFYVNCARGQKRMAKALKLSQKHFEQSQIDDFKVGCALLTKASDLAGVDV
jgi:hypothetical protein